MDSLTHIALGAAVGMAVMGRRTAAWKAALWGAVANTLPDVDVFVRHGDPILDMVRHRGPTHALFWLSLFSLPFAAGVARLQGEWRQWCRWWLALWLALVTHPLLDTMTVYGTQLALPFSDHPFAIGSLFIIDPLVTLPLLVGAAWALAGHSSPRGLQANAAGLALAGAYVAWSVWAQQQVANVANASLAAQGIAAERLLVTPTAFNTLLWRVVPVAGGRYYEGYYSLLDDPGASPRITFDRFDQGTELVDGRALRRLDGVRRLEAFSQGFYKLQQQGERLRIADLRMGQEPAYTFTFAVAEAQRGVWVPLAPARQEAGQLDLPRSLAWLWRRALGRPLPPPR
jgi:inner membrane protein